MEKEDNPMTRRRLERDRHLRLASFAAVSISLTLFAYFFLDFGRPKALAYGVCAFVLLNLLNYRHILAKIEVSTRSKQDRG